MSKRQKRKRKRLKLSSTESPHSVGQSNTRTGSFHKDGRATMVIVGDKIYSLTPTTLTIQQLSNQDPKERPHVRFLNSIPVRSEYEQEMKNGAEHDFHEIYKLIDSTHNDKVTSVKKAIRMGANVPDEVAKLLELKRTTKDPDEKRKIRQQLRKLDYKRYSEKEN